MAVSYTGDGEGVYPPSAEALPTGKLLLRRNDWSREEFRQGASFWQNSWTDYRVDPSRDPHAIDFILRDPYDRCEIVYPGIYERKGDILRICRTIQMYGPRPTLPAMIQVLSAGTAAETTGLAIGRIAITRHRLFSSPEPLLASLWEEASCDYEALGAGSNDPVRSSGAEVQPDPPKDRDGASNGTSCKKILAITFSGA
jgi:hypothetical protein